MALDDQDTKRCLVYYSKPSILEYLEYQVIRSLTKKEVCFGVYKNGIPVAMTGILEYKDGIESITYVSKKFRKSGTNTACKHFVYALSVLLNQKLYAGAKLWNKLSIASIQNHWPNVQPVLTNEVSPNGVGYSSLDWFLSVPPRKGKPPC